MVVGMSLYAQIREAYTSGESQRPIAKRLGVSRQTVKKYCEGEIMPGVRKEYLRAPSVVPTEIEHFIHECLEAEQEEGLRKQTHTAKRFYLTFNRHQSELLFKVIADLSEQKSIIVSTNSGWNRQSLILITYWSGCCCTQTFLSIRS